MMKDSAGIIKRAGLKLTPQRKMVYEAVLHLGHASVEEIMSSVQAMVRRYLEAGGNIPGAIEKVQITIKNQ